MSKKMNEEKKELERIHHSSSNCLLCDRLTPDFYLEIHHLIPISHGGKKKETTIVCCTCHDAIHVLLTNGELTNELNTADKIKEHSEMKEYIDWVQRLPKNFSIPVSKDMLRRIIEPRYGCKLSKKRKKGEKRKYYQVWFNRKRVKISSDAYSRMFFCQELGNIELKYNKLGRLLKIS